LVARRMRALEDDIRTLSATTVASALRDNNFDFMATIGNIVPITVVANLIGFRDTNPMQLLQAAFESTTMVGGTMPLDRLNDLVTPIGVLHERIADQVPAAGEGADETILLAVQRALDLGALEMGEVQTILHTLLSAGGEATTSLLGNAVRMLAEDPALQQELRDRPDHINVFAEEALRLRSPFSQ